MITLNHSNIVDCDNTAISNNIYKEDSMGGGGIRKSSAKPFNKR